VLVVRWFPFVTTFSMWWPWSHGNASLYLRMETKRPQYDTRKMEDGHGALLRCKMAPLQSGHGERWVYNNVQGISLTNLSPIINTTFVWKTVFRRWLVDKLYYSRLQFLLNRLLAWCTTRDGLTLEWGPWFGCGGRKMGREKIRCQIILHAFQWLPNLHRSLEVW